MELALSEYGAWDESYGKPADNLDYLIDSFIRRKRWEWDQAAVHIANSVSKAVFGGGGERPRKMASNFDLMNAGFKVSDGTQSG